jgi:hypothetical protein
MDDSNQDFQLIDKSEIIPPSLLTQEEDNVTFLEAMREMFHTFPSMKHLFGARNSALGVGNEEGVKLADCAIATQIWLLFLEKNKTSSDDLSDQVKTMESLMVRLWNEYVQIYS